jgi:hypothetical protein
LYFSQELLTAGVMVEEDMVVEYRIHSVGALLVKVVEMMLLQHNYSYPPLCL